MAKSLLLLYITFIVRTNVDASSAPYPRLGNAPWSTQSTRDGSGHRQTHAAFSGTSAVRSFVLSTHRHRATVCGSQSQIDLLKQEVNAGAGKRRYLDTVSCT